jgi:hypothetical protein
VRRGRKARDLIETAQLPTYQPSTDKERSMSRAIPSRRIARLFTLLLSTGLLSVAAPAVSQARTHATHHQRPAAGNTAPYTRLVVATNSNW